MPKRDRGSARSETRERLAPTLISSLRGRFDGDIIQPGDRPYDDARQVWNAMIDRHPALILRPIGTADVAAAVRFAREAGLEVAVRGGGHSPAGHSTVDDGVVIDLSRIRGVQVAPDRLTAWVGGGGILADLDRETGAHGLAVPAGVAWDTGVGGLTLGGGYGWLSRLRGLTIDSLEVAELVTASGETVVASGDRDPELLWGLRGGGGNFGIVTWFGFRLHPVPPVVHTVDLVFHVRDVGAVVAAYRDLCTRVGREVTTYLGLQNAGPSDGVPPELVDRAVAWFGAVVIDAQPRLDAITDPMRAAAIPLVERSAAMTYRDLQRSSSEPPGARRNRYWRGNYVRELTDPFLAAFIDDDWEADRPVLGEVELVQVGGAINDVAPDATAYAQRDAGFDVLAVGYWDDPAENDARIAALRAASDRTSGFASGVYLNNLIDEGEDRVRAAFRDDHFARLRRLKTRMDPDNVFHRNANIPPWP